jgi:cation transport regulator ChaB
MASRRRKPRGGKKEVKKIQYTTKTGYSVERTVGERTAPFTHSELVNQQGTGIVTQFLNSLLPVIRIGFQNVPEGKYWTAYNHASSVLKLTALKGSYPNKAIDFTKVMISTGKLALPENVKVGLIDQQLTFSWDTNVEAEGADVNDRVITVAYFPETGQSLHVISGAKRTEGSEVMRLPKFKDNTTIHTYISFVNRDSTDSSDSVYGGELNYTIQEISKSDDASSEEKQSLVKQATVPRKIRQPGRPKNGVRSRKKVAMPAQNLRMQLVSKAQKLFRRAINIGFDSKTAKGTARDRATKYNLLHAVKGAYPELEIDYSKLKFSKGSREGVWGGNLTMEQDYWIKLDWEIPEQCNFKKIGNDTAYVLFYKPTLHWGNDVGIQRFQSVRSALSHRIRCGKQEGDDLFVHVWMFFVSPDGKQRSDTYYFGSGYLKAKEG